MYCNISVCRLILFCCFTFPIVPTSFPIGSVQSVSCRSVEKSSEWMPVIHKNSVWSGCDYLQFIACTAVQLYDCTVQVYTQEPQPNSFYVANVVLFLVFLCIVSGLVESADLYYVSFDIICFHYSGACDYYLLFCF